MVSQRNDILGRHFEALGILVIEDGRFFEWMVIDISLRAQDQAAGGL